MIVSPSLLSADFGNLQRDIEMLNASEADWFHLDVMDGVFVPNISFGFPVMEAMAKAAKKPLDVHLMIVEPQKFVSQVAALGAKIMNVHYEACVHLHRVVQQIKDAGMMAASWAQYRAQEALVNLTEELGIELTLFHGRGGTIGRGGAPAHAALLSPPPRSLKNGLRVTEQGEMIRFKLGLPEVAVETFDLYASAILEANLLPPPEPKAEWRAVMDELSATSCDIYRSVVRGDKDFVPYFRSATPDQELSKLPLGSRPAKRNPNGGVESLRAIPWIFAWMQNRLMLPAWLGAGAAIQKIVDEGKGHIIEEMCKAWPFFSTRVGMLEMVFSKTDTWLSEQYDHNLVKKELWYLGENLRNQLNADIKTVLSLSHKDELMADLPWIADSIALRNVYTDPLNLLQVELLRRFRESPENPSPDVEQALMITITGIAAGMRNTG